MNLKVRLSNSTAIAIGFSTTIAASVWFWHTSHAFASALFIVCPGIAFTGMLLMGSDDVVGHMQHWIDQKPLRVLAVPIGLWMLYLVYALGMDIAGIRQSSIMAVYLGIPFLVFASFRNAPSRVWIEPAMILWIWFPLEFGLIRSALITRQGSDLHYVF